MRVTFEDPDQIILLRLPILDPFVKFPVVHGITGRQTDYIHLPTYSYYLGPFIDPDCILTHSLEQAPDTAASQL